jgi:hypothetical protein
MVYNKITGFKDFVPLQYSKNWRKRFGNWMFFHPRVKGKISILLDGLERANLNHWSSSDLKKNGPLDAAGR